MGKLLYNDNIFNRTMSKVFDLILLGILTFICSLPIITAGASFMAAYRIMLEMMNDHEGPVSIAFFRYFRYILKNDFKDSIKGWGIIFIFYAVLLTDLFLLTKADIEYRSFLYGISIVLLVSVIAISDWYFVLKAVFNEDCIKTLKNSVGFFFVYLIQSLLMGIYTVAAFYILTQFPYLIGIVVIFGSMLLKYPFLPLYKNKIDKYLVDKGIESEAIGINIADETEDEIDDECKDKSYDKNIDAADNKEKIREAFKQMNMQQKAEYIFMYYKMYMAVAGAVLLIIGVIIHQIFFVDHRDCYQVAVVNAYVKESDTDISDRLSDTIVEDKSKEKVYFDTQYQLEYPGAKNMMSDTSFQEKLLLNISVGAVDAAILPKGFVDFCNGTEYIFRDVSTVLSEENMSVLKDKLIYSKDEEGRNIPCGVIISDADFIDREDFSFIEGSSGDDAILVFPINANHDGFCNDFVEELVGEKINCD